jgi:phage tail sheath protein FI
VQGALPIIGASTDTAAFFGETQSGDFAPRLITSFADYQQWFGGVFAPSKFMPHAVQGFFENGGRRAVICRISDSDRDSIDKALAALEGDAWRDVSLVYAPNATTDVAGLLVAHCEKLRHRFAVIDCAPRTHDASQLSPQAAIAASSRAAFYYPWIYTNEPGTTVRTLTPPGGHVLGIYARTDIERGVFKAPANELVRGALDIEFAVTSQVQNTLPLKGVNVIRSFQGEAYFVKCDQTTMTQDDITNGRLVCTVGLAVFKPAEFVIFRLVQKTLPSQESP